MSGNPAFYKKMVSVVKPDAVVDGAAFTTTEIDTVDATLGKAAYVNIYVYIGSTETAVTEMLVTESDTAGSGHAAITGADFAGALPAATDDGTFWCFTIVMGANRKRYLDLSLTNGSTSTGGYACAWAELCFTGIQATSATQLGLGGLKSV
jgi:hypothetical protein